MRALFAAAILSRACVPLFAQDVVSTGAVAVNAVNINATTFSAVTLPSTSLPILSWGSTRQGDSSINADNRTVGVYWGDDGESSDISPFFVLPDPVMPQPLPVPLNGTSSIPALDGLSNLQPVPFVVPEPSSMALGTLACGLILSARRFRPRKFTGF